MTSVVGWTGRRSRPSTRGFSATVATRALSVRVGVRLGGRGHLHGVPPELVAQCRVDPRRERVLAAAREALVEGGRDDGRRDALVDRVLDRPAALARVLDVRLEPGEVVALLLERPRGELA